MSNLLETCWSFRKIIPQWGPKLVLCSKQCGYLLTQELIGPVGAHSLGLIHSLYPCLHGHLLHKCIVLTLWWSRQAKWHLVAVSFYLVVGWDLLILWLGWSHKTPTYDGHLHLHGYLMTLCSILTESMDLTACQKLFFKRVSSLMHLSRSCSKISGAGIPACNKQFKASFPWKVLVTSWHLLDHGGQAWGLLLAQRASAPNLLLLWAPCKVGKFVCHPVGRSKQYSQRWNVIFYLRNRTTYQKQGL